MGLRVLSGVPGQSGGLDSLIPTKTSRLVVQSGGSAVRSEMTGDQVCSILFFVYVLQLVFASLRSMSSLVVMAFFHLVSVAVLLWSLPPITRSHLSDQIR